MAMARPTGAAARPPTAASIHSAVILGPVPRIHSRHVPQRRQRWLRKQILGTSPRMTSVGMGSGRPARRQEAP